MSIPTNKYFGNSPNPNNDNANCTYSKICNLPQFSTKYPISSPITILCFYFINAVSYIHHVWLCSLDIKRSADIEDNTGPKPTSCEYLSICHWNLNSITPHNFIKLSLLRAYISINKIDIICLSETYLDSSIDMTTWTM